MRNRPNLLKRFIVKVQEDTNTEELSTFLFSMHISWAVYNPDDFTLIPYNTSIGFEPVRYRRIHRDDILYSNNA